ncbi:MAG: hypothetical protein V9H26_19910 [Verrucomicrobiota bacterium]
MNTHAQQARSSLSQLITPNSSELHPHGNRLWNIRSRRWMRLTCCSSPTYECVGVEVKSAISDAYPADYERGLYQTIKYRALLTAMTHDKRYAMPSNIRVVLVLESQLPLEYKTTAEVLGVEVIENVRVHPNQAITQASTGS